MSRPIVLKLPREAVDLIIDALMEQSAALVSKPGRGSLQAQAERLALSVKLSILAGEIEKAVQSP